MPWLPKQRVIVPVDFSDHSGEGARVARQLVADGGALHVVHVLPSLHAGDPGVVWGEVDDSRRQESVRAEMRKRLGEHIEGATLHVLFGSPGARIADLAEEIGADLVVVPSHGRTGLKRLALGSVAEKLVRLCPCPVLVLRR